MAAMPPHDQPWLAFSSVRWKGGLERRLVRIFDDRIEVRAGRFAVDTQTIPMDDVYGVKFGDDGSLRVVVVPDDLVITEGTDRDRALAAELIVRNAPPPRRKPKPQPKPKPKPEPKPAPKPKPEPKPAPKPKPKPKPAPKPKPEQPDPEADKPPAPDPSPQPEPERQPVGVQEGPRLRRALRALALLIIGTVLAAGAIVLLVAAFVWVVAQLL